MKKINLVFKIPYEFIFDFIPYSNEFNCLAVDSLDRVIFDIKKLQKDENYCCLSGLYEVEILEMLRDSFKIK